MLEFNTGSDTESTRLYKSECITVRKHRLAHDVGSPATKRWISPSYSIEARLYGVHYGWRSAYPITTVHIDSSSHRKRTVNKCLSSNHIESKKTLVNLSVRMARLTEFYLLREYSYQVLVICIPYRLD